MVDTPFLAKNGLVANGGFTANSTLVTLGSNLSINTSALSIIGNATANVTIGATSINISNFFVNTSQISAGSQALYIQKIGANYGIYLSDINQPTTVSGYLNVNANLSVNNTSLFLGNTVFAGNGVNGFLPGNGNNATYSTHNLKLQIQNGLGLVDGGGVVKGVWNSVSGILDTFGGFNVNNTSVIDSNRNFNINSVTITNNCNIGNNLVVSGNSTITKSCNVGGDQFISGNSTITKSCNVGGDQFISGNSTITNNCNIGNNLIVSGNANFTGIATAVTPNTTDSSNKIATTALTDAKIAAFIIKSYLTGFTLSNNNTSPNTTLDIGNNGTGVAVGGMACADDNSVYINISSIFSKTTAAFVLGTGNGALDAGSITSNTWYHVFVIYNPTTLVSDVLFSLSSTSPTMPSGFTKKRRIGSFSTNAGNTNIKGFIQRGDYFQWKIATLDYSGTTAAIPSAQTLTVPTGVNVVARFRAIATSASVNVNLIFYSLDETTPTASATNSNLVLGSGYNGAGTYDVMTNTSGQIGAATNGGAGTALNVNTYGWIDPRGKI